MIISDRFWRRTIVTAIAAIGFVQVLLRMLAIVDVDAGSNVTG